MDDIRLIDANALCKGINESIKMALDWENEALEQKDTCGVKHAIATRQSLLAMLERVQLQPTIDAQPVKLGKWVKYPSIYRCSNCGNPKGTPKPYCELCGARMEVDEDEQAQ